MSCVFAQYDAAYLLGALAPAERQAFEEHLGGCPGCTRAVQELAGLPGLLSRVDLAAVENQTPVGPVPGSVLAGLVREVRRTEARRRRRLGAVGALAAAAVAAGVLMVSTLGGNEPGATATAHRPPAVSTVTPSTQPGVVAGRAMTQVGQHQLRAWVGVEDVAWGTRLRLTCRYQNAGGYAIEPAPAYSLVVRTRDGHTQRVATWRAVPGRTTTLDAATASPRDQISSVEVRTLAGHPVLRLHT